MSAGEMVAEGSLRTVNQPTTQQEGGARGPSGAPATIDRCILLAGGLKPSPIVAAAGCSVLDLPLSEGSTVLETWLAGIAEVGPGPGRTIDVSVVYGAGFPAPKQPREVEGLDVRVTREPRPYRGPAGVASDIFRERPVEGNVLIAESGRYLGCSLRELLAAHVARGAEITVAANADNTPAGLYLVRGSALSLVPGQGFMDVKEQWLKRAVEASMGVWVFRLSPPGVPLMRTREQVLSAVGWLQRRARVCGEAAGSPVAERASVYEDRGGEGFRLICPGSRVGEGAVVHDSIVMAGSNIGAGAVVVRSLVCPGADIPPGDNVVDAVVTAQGRSSGSRRDA